jgi:GGDEF domain-containing protein
MMGSHCITFAVLHIIDRLYDNLKGYNAKESRRYTLSISVGTAHFDPEYPISIDELLSKADALMYAQKRKKLEKHSF